MPNRDVDGRFISSNSQAAHRPGRRYNKSFARATRILQQHTAAIATAQHERTWTIEREKLLVDLIFVQEEIGRILDLQAALLANIEAAPDPRAAARAAAGATIADQASCSSWCTSILSRMTVGHIMHVKQMSMQDWCTRVHNSFVRLSALLELCNRDMHTVLASGAALCGTQAAGANGHLCQQGQLAAGAAADGAATSTDDSAAASIEAVRWPRAAAAQTGHSTRQCALGGGTATLAGVSAGPAGVANAPAGARAPAAPAVAISEATAQAEGCTASTAGSTAVSAAAAEAVDLSESACDEAGAFSRSAARAAVCSPIAALYEGADLALLDLVEQLSITVFACLFYNPHPYYAAAMYNLITGQPELMPQSHVLQVLQRLQLSHQQLQHLRIAHSEFARLARLTSQEGESLAEVTAKLSLSAVVDNITAADGPAGETLNPVQDQQQQGSGLSPRFASTGAWKAARAAAAEHLDRFKQSAPSHACSATGGAGRTAAAAAAAGQQQVELGGGETPGEALSRQLDRYLRHMHIHTLVTAMCVFNTLTPRQMAMLTVASYPYVPNVHALAEAAVAYEPPVPPAAPQAAAEEQQQQQQQAKAGSRRQGPGEPRQQQQQQGGASDAQWRRQVDVHMAVRGMQLEQQVCSWWARNLDLLKTAQQEGEGEAA